MSPIKSVRCLQEQQRSPRTYFEQYMQHQSQGYSTCMAHLRWHTVKLRGARLNPSLRFLRNYLDLVLFSAIINPEIALTYFNVLILPIPKLTGSTAYWQHIYWRRRPSEPLSMYWEEKKTMASLFHPKFCIRSVSGLQVPNQYHS